MGSNIAARAATAGELIKFRGPGQLTKLGLAIQQPITVYTARINQTFDTLDGVAQLTYDGGSGTLADVLPGMSVFVGSTAGARDKGILRVRKAPSATVLYIGQVSNVQFAEDDYLTVVDAMALWQRDIVAAGGVVLMDYDIPFGSYFNGGCIPRIGPIAAVLELVDGSVTFNPPDPTDSACYDGATVSSYLYEAPGAASTADMDTSAPEWTYDTAGQYRWSCTITDSLGRETTSYRWIFVDPDPLVFELTSNPVGDLQSGYWQFAVTLFEDATTADIYERALVTLYAAKEYYNGEAGAIGKIAGYENIECTGWIDGESITHDPDAGTVTFTVLGPGYWLGKMRAFPFELQDTSGSPTSWKEITELTVDKALAHLLFWTSTAPFVMDCYFTGDTTRKQIITEPSGSLKSQLDAIALNNIFARTQTNNLGQLYVEIDQQLMDTTVRAALPVVQDITTVDYLGALDIQRSTSEKACMVELGGYEAYDGASLLQIYSRAPGNSPITFGEPRSYNNYIFADQDECNRVAGALLAAENNEFEPFDISLSANNRLIDIAPRMACTISLAAGDTPRGIVLSTARLIPRRVERAYDKVHSVMLTNVTFEFETTGVDGIDYVPPVVGDNIPDLGIGDYGAVDFPDADLGDWFPESVPPVIENDCGAGKINQFMLSWDTSLLVGEDSTKLIARCYFPCWIRSSYLTTTILLNGFWRGDAPSHYGVYGVKDGARVLTAVVSEADHNNVATFSPLSDTEVDGFELELEAGLGSSVEYIPGQVAASGNVDVNLEAGVAVTGAVAGNYYSLEGTNGPYQDAVIQIDSWAIQMSNNDGSSYSAFGYNGSTFLLPLPAWGEYSEAVPGTNYGRLYFEMEESTALRVRANDSSWEPNTGTLGYILREAYFLGRQIELGSLLIKNVCAPL